MIIYILLILALILLNFSKLKLKYEFSCFLVFCISAFRAPTVGTDTINYVIGFINNQFRGHMTEPGFLILASGLRKISDEPFLFLFVTSLFALLPIFYSIKKLSRNPTYTLFLFVCVELVFWLSGMRQAISISFYIFSLHLFLNRKYVSSFIFFCISLSFHLSVLITIPIILLNYFLPYEKHIKQLQFAIFVSALIGLSKIIDLNSIIVLFSNIFGLEKYAYYAIYEFNTSIPFTRLFVQIVPFSFFSILFLKNSNGENKNLLTSLFVYGTLINNLILVHPIGFRLAKYFSILLIIMVPLCLSYLGKYKKVVRYGYILFVIIYFVYGLYSRLATKEYFRNDVVPYEFINLF